MINRKFFFDTVRTTLVGKLTPSQVLGMTAILDEWERIGHTDDRWVAYMLATTFHETAATMQPIEEYGKGKKRPYGSNIRMNGRRYWDTGAIFYGRGFVQLTWYENYDKAGKKLGIDLLHYPQLALDLNIATQIMFLGMQEGWFTGKKLTDYFNEDKEDWYNARRIINGTDRAQLIADYALKFYAALSHK